MILQGNLLDIARQKRWYCLAMSLLLPCNINAFRIALIDNYLHHVKGTDGYRTKWLFSYLLWLVLVPQITWMTLILYLLRLVLVPQMTRINTDSLSAQFASSAWDCSWHADFADDANLFIWAGWFLSHRWHGWHWFFICAICVFCVRLFLARRFRRWRRSN